jgi:hypothetical protein
MKAAALAILAAGAMAFTVGAASAASPKQCDRYARNYANQYANPAGSAVGGAMLGAFAGAALSGITGGNVGKGAAFGAGAGAVGGLVTQGPRWQQLYADAYDDCMYGGGGPQPAYGPGPGSEGWYQACAAKYKSFQWDGPWEGHFKGYDGQWRPCQL